LAVRAGRQSAPLRLRPNRKRSFAIERGTFTRDPEQTAEPLISGRRIVTADVGAERVRYRFLLPPASGDCPGATFQAERNFQICASMSRQRAKFLTCALQEISSPS